jgi:hypothetical protein
MRVSFSRAVIAITALTAALLPITTGSANAAPTNNTANPPVAVIHHDIANVVAIRREAPHRTTTLITRIPRASIRTMASADRRSRTVATLRGKGSPVTARCYLAGERVAGDRTWYRTVSPSAGYIAGADLAIRHEPALHVYPCALNKLKK